MTRTARGLIPLYAASTLLVVGEGSFQLLTPPYMHGRHLSSVLIGVAVSAYGLASLVVRLPAGAFYRSHRAWTLIAGGTLLSSAAFALLTVTASPVLLVLLVALDGAGFAIATTANMAALIERRPAGSNAGSIMGWYTGSIGLGYALAGFVGGALGDALGVRAAILLLACVPLAAGALLVGFVRSTQPERAPVEQRGAWWRSFHGLPGAVWLAFFVTLYLNLVSGVLLTFYPLYGLAIGLSLSQIGAFQGVYGGAASIVRFLSGLIFRHVAYEKTLALMVCVSGVSIAAIAGLRTAALLVVPWAALGLARGLLRVSSAALVMDEAGESDAARGAASGVYLAGLDLGKIVGPLAGGVGIGAVGFRTTFLTASVVLPAVYLALAATVRRRGMSLDSGHGSARTEEQTA